MAIAATRTPSTQAVQKIGLRRRSRMASAVRLRGFSASSSGPVTGVAPGRVSAATTEPMSLIADPRIEHGVEQIDDEAEEQVHDHQHADEADHERTVLGADPAEQLEPNPGDVEHAL